MAESSTQDKTEQPSAERLRKARQEGQLPESQELYSGLMVLALIIVLALTCGPLTQEMISAIREGVSFRLTQPMGQEGLHHLMAAKAGQALLAMAPVAAAGMVISILGSVIVGGWTYSPGRMKLRFETLNPMTGFKNLFSVRSIVQLLTSVAKVTVISIVSWNYLRDHMPVLTNMTWLQPWQILVTTGDLLLGVMTRIAVCLLVIAAADLLYQRWSHRRKLRMTKQEVKEEHKQHEQGSEVKGRIRAIQFATARRRVLQEVPTADVVVVNPTHVAVALRYEAGAMAAPVVVAKGGDLMCQRIKEVARAHRVPIVQKPSLARMIYDTVKIGEPIPQPLFVAVAEVLAMIYRLRAQRRLLPR
ncbi:MAG: flagellar biosynthesis protein FlhB [Planctomycetota bacterium]